MNRMNPEIWSLLKDSQPSGDNLNARLPFAHITRQFYCGLDVNRVRHFLIKLSDEDQDVCDNQSRGLTVATRKLVLSDNIPSRYLDIECKEISGYSSFNFIGEEIVNEMVYGHKKPIDAVKGVLAKWRRFWGQLPQQILSREAQIGLFAELWFIHVWLLPRYGTSAVYNWRGPWGSRHDFEWEDKAVEVKATTSSHRRVFVVHGIDQLEHPANGPLFLFGMSLREEYGATNTLPGVVKMINNSIANDEEALSIFETALFKFGYSPAHEEEYSKIHMRVVGEELYSVKEDFPRITRASFVDKFPVGIEQVEYNIDLSGFVHLIVASRPVDLPF